MLHEKLKTATSVHHDELERLMYVQQIMNKTLSLEQYKILLATNYIIHSTLESRLHEGLTDELTELLDIKNRNKLAALENDLLEMSVDKNELDAIVYDVNIEVNNTATSLGAMYVLEGATLGGNVIRKKLRSTAAFENLNLHYYGVYAESLMPNWMSFLEVLNTAVPETEYRLAEKSAVDMFLHIAKVSKSVKTLFADTTEN